MSTLSDNYWIVGGDINRFWSSKKKAYVTVDDADFNAWTSRNNIPARVSSEAELSELLVAVGLGKLAPYYIPKSVYMWQAKTAIAAIGKLEQADAAIEASNNSALILAWHTAPEISRASPAVAAIGQMLGLTATDIDNLFIQAESFKV